jgi:hypothetical protein
MEGAMPRADYRTVLITVVIAGLTAVAATAHAQSAIRPYVGASIGSFNLDSDDVDGRTGSAGIVGGAALSRYVDVEVEVAFPRGSFTRSYTGVSLSFAPQGSSREEIERMGVISRWDWDRKITSSLSAVVVIHPAVTARVVPALVAGVTNQRTRTILRSTPLIIPVGVDPQHPSVVAREERGVRNMGGATIGGQIAILVAPRLAIVPDLRFDYGSIGDEIHNTLRASVRTIWKF